MSLALHEISFPVYRVGPTKPSNEDGVLFFAARRDNLDGSEDYRLSIVDDKNVPGDTLAVRRLFLKNRGDKLAPLNKAIFFLGDFVKLAKSSIWFIDREGQLFTYTKTRRAKLIYRKISKITPISSGGAIVEVEGIPSRFKVLFAPTDNEQYAGLLLVGQSYILYGLYDQKYDDTHRLI